MVEESVVFSPEIPDRELKRETGKIQSELDGIDESISPDIGMDGLDLDGLGAEGARAGGDNPADELAGIGAVLSSRLPASISGTLASSVMPIALAGGVGLGMLSAMRGASARLQTSSRLLGQAWNNVWRPIGDDVDKLFVRPVAEDIVDATEDFETTWKNGQEWDAVAGLLEKSLNVGEEGGGETTSAGRAGRVIGGGVGLFAGASKGAAIGATAGSVIPGAGTLGGAIVGGIIGGLAGTAIGTRIGEWLGKQIGQFLPDISFPDIPVPAAAFGLPTISVPDTSFELPTIGVPSFKFDISTIPVRSFKFDIGRIDVPSFKFNLPTIDVPAANFDLPDIDLPDGGGGGGGGGGGFDIPFFQRGGVVSGPTAGVVGEAGPEVVAPLDRFERLMRDVVSSVNQAGGGGGGRNTRRLERKLDDVVAELRRTRGAIQDQRAVIERESLSRAVVDSQENQVFDTDPRV